MLSIGLDKRLDGLPQFGGAPGAEPAQRFARKNTKPDFHLVEPTGRGGREVKVNVRMLEQPGSAFFVRAIIIQDHMQFLLSRRFGDHLIHKLKKLLSPLQLRDGGFDLAGGYFQRGEEIQRSVTLIGASETAHNLAIVGFNVAGLSLQSLDAGLLINRDHQRFLGRIEIQTDDISRFDGELFVRADAPRTLPPQ